MMPDFQLYLINTITFPSGFLIVITVAFIYAPIFQSLLCPFDTGLQPIPTLKFDILTPHDIFFIHQNYHAV